MQILLKNHQYKVFN